MTAFCGVNLREEDIPTFGDACSQAGVEPASVPVLAILHDDTLTTLQESLAAFVGLDVRAWRCMVRDSRLTPTRLPQKAHIIGWNEADESQDWWDAWWKWVRQQRPDLTIHYGAPNVNMQWPENTALEATLDVVDRHIGSTFSPPAAVIQGKPVWVTEIDIDPSRFEVDGGPYPWGPTDQQTQAYGELADCMKRCLQAGIPAFAWGIQSYAPDAAYVPSVLQAIVAMNANQPQGGAPMADHTLGPGFAQFAQANGLKPLTDEFYVESNQCSFAMTDGGLMVYTKDDNQVRLLPPKA